jgi:hypothetical protein
MYGTHEERQDFFYTGSQLTHGQRRVKQVYGNVQQDGSALTQLRVHIAVKI